MDRGLPHFFRSYLHTKDQPLSSYYAVKPQWAWERRVTSKCREPTETPLIFHEFSGPGLLKASGEKSQPEVSPPWPPLSAGSQLRNAE